MRSSPRKAGLEKAKLGGRKRVWLWSVQTSLTNPNQAFPVTFLCCCMSGNTQHERQTALRAERRACVTAVVFSPGAGRQELQPRQVFGEAGPLIWGGPFLQAQMGCTWADGGGQKGQKGGCACMPAIPGVLLCPAQRCKRCAGAVQGLGARPGL